MNVLFVFAHPDDESFSSGGTITKLAKKGARVKLITATKGEEGELGTPYVCSKKDLGAVREKELLRASKILGLSHVYFLGFKDSTLKRIPKQKLIKPVSEIMLKEKPDMVFTFGRDGGSKHPDHVTMNQVATDAFEFYRMKINKHVRLYYTSMPRENIRLLEKHGIAYNAFGKIRGVLNNRITTTVDIKDTFKNKIDALKCHKTQNKDVERFLTTAQILDIQKEYFYLAREYNFI